MSSVVSGVSAVASVSSLPPVARTSACSRIARTSGAVAVGVFAYLALCYGVVLAASWQKGEGIPDPLGGTLLGVLLTAAAASVLFTSGASAPPGMAPANGTRV